MPVESAADRAVFFSPDDFGVAATYAPAAGASADVNGIFDDPTLLQTIGERAMTLDSRATFNCRQADLPPGAASGAGDRLLLSHPVSGIALEFEVSTIEPDGQGFVVCVLAILAEA